MDLFSFLIFGLLLILSFLWFLLLTFRLILVFVLLFLWLFCFIRRRFILQRRIFNFSLTISSLFISIFLLIIFFLLRLWIFVFLLASFSIIFLLLQNLFNIFFTNLHPFKVIINILDDFNRFCDFDSCFNSLSKVFNCRRSSCLENEFNRLFIDSFLWISLLEN